MSEISMQQLKEQRLTPAEKFVLDAIKGAKPKEPDMNSSVVWCKNGEWVFTQNFSDGYLFLGSETSWYLEIVFNLNFDEIQQLLTKLLYKYTNNGELKIKF